MLNGRSGASRFGTCPEPCPRAPYANLPAAGRPPAATHSLLATRDGVVCGDVSPISHPAIRAALRVNLAPGGRVAGAATGGRTGGVWCGAVLPAPADGSGGSTTEVNERLWHDMMVQGQQRRGNPACCASRHCAIAAAFLAPLNDAVHHSAGAVAAGAHQSAAGHRRAVAHGQAQVCRGAKG